MFQRPAPILFPVLLHHQAEALARLRGETVESLAINLLRSAIESSSNAERAVINADTAEVKAIIDQIEPQMSAVDAMWNRRRNGNDSLSR
jgi:hypothetical protein